MINSEDLKRESRKYIKYEKDTETKIATLTFARPSMHNALNNGMKMILAETIFKANIDDDVKVLVIKGEGDHLGTGAELSERGDMFSNPTKEYSLLHEFEINDPDVKYPPRTSFRALFGLTEHLSKARSGTRALQEFKKISIVQAKGYCYGYHFYLASDADILIASEDTLFGHPAFRYAGWGPRLWNWVEAMGYRKFAEMLFTGRPFTAQEMYQCNFVNSVVPRDKLEEETEKYALACSRSRPVDTVVMQKTFLEFYKQHRGEYFGSLLTGLVEGLLPSVKEDVAEDIHFGKDVFDRGLANTVRDFEMRYPPEWRMSFGGRRKP
jgi:enoyl-CoA hydratase/carnithine racemase